MAKITKIEVQKKDKNRCNLFLDGEFLAGVSLETAIKEGLKEGKELDKNKLGEIIFTQEKEKALKKAIDYISKALKTKRQVIEYLERKEYSTEVINITISKMLEYGLIDDVEFSRRYIESTSKKQGKKLIEFKLMSKGVKKQDIEKAYESIEETDEDGVYNLAIKHLKNKERTRENLGKTYKYLVGKGFLFEEIDRAMSRIKEEED